MARTDTRTHARRLRRGRRWWDLVSPIHGSAGGSTTQVAELALQYLDLKEGQTVLDLGCGSGAALPTLREAVGPSGRVVGIDYSPRMLARAEAVVRERGFENVELRRADATRVAAWMHRRNGFREGRVVTHEDRGDLGEFSSCAE